MGGEQYNGIGSNTNENLPPQEAGANPNNTDNKETETDEWKTVEWFGGNRGFWQDALFKWIILALEEPTDSEERNVIEKGLNVLKREVGEIFTARMMDEKRYKICSDVLKSCHDYMVTQDASINVLIREDLLKRIFGYLNMDLTQANYMLEIVRKISVSKRSVLRFMMHQSIQARVAYIRTALKNHQKLSDMEGYHCTTNPYYHELMDDLSKRQSTCVALNSELNELRQLVQDMQSKLTDNEKLLHEQIELNAKLAEEKEQLNEDFKNEYTQLKDEMTTVISESESAKSEATVYQAALGNVTNVRWSDDTPNNPIQLIKDIQKLRQRVDEFTKVKGKAYKIKDEDSLELLKHYNSKVDPTLKDTRQIKTLLSFALQRLVLKTIFDAAEKLYNRASNASQYTDAYLEPFIVYHAEELIKYSSELASSRDGSDSIASVTPIKIRQQIYASLSLRAYSKNRHPYIRRIADELIGKIEKYREIVDEDKQKELRSETESLIRAGIQFWFSLKTQEPVPKIRWHDSGAQIRTHIMEGSWDADEKNGLEVDFCYFPFIIANRQVYCKASVATRPKAGKVQKVLNQVFGFISN